MKMNAKEYSLIVPAWIFFTVFSPFFKDTPGSFD